MSGLLACLTRRGMLKSWEDYPFLKTAFPGEEVLEFYAVPSFINPHAHLELSHLRGQLEVLPENFPVWAGKLKTLIQGWKREQWEASFFSGIRECLASGTTLVIDHTYSFCSVSKWVETKIAGSPAPEMFGIENKFAPHEMQRFHELFQANQETIKVIAPHAPVSVSEKLYLESIKFARKNNLLLSLHLAETLEELEFVRKGSGPFRKFLLDFKRSKLSEYIPPDCTPIEYLDRLGGLGRDTLAIHCNYLSDSDIDILAKRGTSVVHCPGTYEFFGHREFRFRELQEAGVNLCLASDSLASTDTLSLLATMRQVRCNYSWLSLEDIFNMGTKNTLSIESWTEKFGALEKDFVVFPWKNNVVSENVTVNDILKELLEGDAEPEAVFIQGELAWQREKDTDA